MKLFVTVTTGDIRKGKKNNPRHCPIACAVKRLYPGNYVSVNEDTLELDELIFALPEDAGRFVSQFDADEKVAPFKFLMEY